MISGKNKTGIPADRNYLLHLNNLVHLRLMIRRHRKS